jgi:hypothetical protein
MTIKTSLGEIYVAFSAFSALNENVKLGQNGAWAMARMLRKMKGYIKDFERAKTKLFVDAGGNVIGTRIEMPQFEMREGESEADMKVRRTAFTDKVAELTNEIQELNDQEIDFELDPLKLSMFPMKAKNDKGEETEVLYNANLFADAGPFLENDLEKQ